MIKNEAKLKPVKKTKKNQSEQVMIVKNKITKIERKIRNTANPQIRENLFTELKNESSNFNGFAMRKEGESGRSLKIS